ncbi:MAG TPA: pyridoxal phosphate-dependent aminotransferase [Treponemataceae bacterium]|nr:pyridoxal phosphate-dependent aminotransferase [Treponemataceae bacterium]
MAVAKKIYEKMTGPGASVIRKMFEEGAALKKQYGEDKVFDFSIGNPDLEPVTKIEDEIANVAKDRTKGRHGYMPNAGYIEARTAMAEKTNLEQHLNGKPGSGVGEKLNADYIVMSCGAAGALNTVFKAILNEGDEVLVPVPYFVEYGHYVHNHGGTLKTISATEDLSVNVKEVASMLNPKTTAIIINSPNNPSGKIYTKENMRALVTVLNAHGEKTGRLPYIILDEPYRAICYNGKKPVSMFHLYSESIVVTSFAKNLSLAGERIGYIAVNPTCQDAASLVNACIFSTRILGYVNAPAFFQKVVAKSWNTNVNYISYENRMKHITEAVTGAGIEYIEPEGAFYLFCKVPPKKNVANPYDDFAFCDHLKKYNILVAPGTGFGCPGFFRISYCVSEKTILNCALPLKKAVQEW